MKIGYLGPRGTFSEQAALRYAQDLPDATLQRYPTIQHVIDAVERGELEEGVVPFENSIEGTVTTAIDTLIFQVDLFIKAEVVIPVAQCLMARPGTEPPFAAVLSHPQGLAQCGGFLHRHYPDTELRPVSSTAEAARLVSQSGEALAAIAPRGAAALYGLDILQPDIEDDHSNETRFVVVTKTPTSHGKQKTSVAFSTDNRPGELYRVLDIFCIWDLNMTKIESRPSKSKLGTYVFFVDLETEEAADLEAALKMVERKATFFKFLGSYPVFTAKR